MQEGAARLSAEALSAPGAELSTIAPSSQFWGEGVCPPFKDEETEAHRGVPSDLPQVPIFNHMTVLPRPLGSQESEQSSQGRIQSAGQPLGDPRLC